MGKGSYLLRCTNFTPEMMEFMRNQESIQRTLARMIEDTVSRFGTGDLFQSTNIQLYSKDEKGVSERNNDKLAVLIANLLENVITTTPPDHTSEPDQVTMQPTETSSIETELPKMEKSKTKEQDMVFDVTDKLGIPDVITEPETSDNDMSISETDVTTEDASEEDEDIILESDTDNEENDRQEEASDNSDNFDLSIWDD